MRKNEVRTSKEKIDEGKMRSAGKYLEKRWNKKKKGRGAGGRAHTHIYIHSPIHIPIHMHMHSPMQM